MSAPAPTEAKITLTLACNNDCSFCYNRRKKDVDPQTIPPERVHELIDQAADQGARSLNLIGGEVTILPWFLEVLAHGGSRFEDVSLNTNGRAFGDPAFARAAVQAGLTTVDVSLHGSRPEVHDRLTRAPGAWAEATAGLRNLVGLAAGGERLSVSVTTLVLAATRDDLLPLGDLLRDIGVQSWRLKAAHGAAGCAPDEARNTYLMRHSDWMPALRAVVERHLGPLNPRVHDVPLCVLGDLLRLSTDFDEQVVALYKARGLEDTVRVTGHWGQASPRCQGCAAADACIKLDPAYVAQYGDAELTPYDPAGWQAARADADALHHRLYARMREQAPLAPEPTRAARFEALDRAAGAGRWQLVRRLATALLEADPRDVDALRARRRAEAHLLNAKAEAAAAGGDPAQARLLRDAIQRRYADVLGSGDTPASSGRERDPG